MIVKLHTRHHPHHSSYTFLGTRTCADTLSPSLTFSLTLSLTCVRRQMMCLCAWAEFTLPLIKVLLMCTVISTLSNNRPIASFSSHLYHSLSHTYFSIPTPICTLSTPPLPLTSPSVPHFHRLINKQLVSLFDGGCECKIKRRRCWRAVRNVGSQNEGEVTGEREGRNQKGCFTESPVWVSGWNSLCSKTWRVNTTVCQ